MDLIETGKIVNTHGIRGEVKIIPWTGDPEQLLDFKELFIESVSYKIQGIRLHKGSLLVKLKGIDTLEQAEMLKNKIVFAESSSFELEEGEYFFRDLIGMDVIDVDTNFCYGKITDIIETGANDVYEVTEDNEKKTKRLVPAIPDCIIDVNLDNKTMKIRPLEGLFDI